MSVRLRAGVGQSNTNRLLQIRAMGLAGTAAPRERKENMVEATKAEIKTRLQDIHDRIQWIDDDEMAAIWFGNTVDHGHEKKTLQDEADKLVSQLNS